MIAIHGGTRQDGCYNLRLERQSLRLWTVRLAAVALLAGGLREPRLAALGGAAAFAAVWLERPALGPAAPWLPWLAWSLLCGLLSAEPLAALPVLARWSAALAFGSLAAGWDARGREAWLKTSLAAAAALAAAALWTGAGRGFRAEMTGLIPPYYNYTAFALAAAAAAAAAWALHPRGPRGAFRAGLLAAAAGLAACIALARSRGALLGLACAAAVWAGRRWGGKALAAAAVAAALAAAAFQGGLLPSSWTFVLVKGDRLYKEARPRIWARAVELADAKPWLGEGPGRFGEAFRRRPVEPDGGAARWGLGTPFAHSEPLNAAAETGWAGLALWLLGLGASLSVLRRRASAEPAREAAAIAAAAMAAQLLVDNMLQIPGLAFLFFSALAVAGEGRGPRVRWPRAAAAAGVLLAAAAWIPRAAADRDPETAARLFPADSEAREDLAYKALAAGRLEAADARFAEAERLAPFDAVYPWRRAQIAGARGRWGEAEALAARAEALEPGFLNDRVLRAEALARLGRTAEARAALSAAERSYRERERKVGLSGYDHAVWDFDVREYERVAALVRAAKR
jgi:O-antigen ligase